VESPPAVRPANPAWANPGAAGSAALLLAAALFAFFPSLTGGFLWDDSAHVTGPQLRSLHGLWRIWFEAGATQQYYPLLHSAFWVEHRLWGDSVLGYHLANVALHAAAAWMLVLALRGLSFPAPLLAGLVFALHPVCVESVAWISEQKNTLSAAIYLASALLYLRFDGSRRRTAYSWAFALYVLALLTKSVTATLPAALLVVLWWRRGRLDWRRDVFPLTPWFAVGTASGLFTAWMEEKFIGAEGAEFSFTAVQRTLLAGRAVVFYIRSLAWPGKLMFVYPRWSLKSDMPLAWACLIGVLALALALVALARRRRGPLAGFLFFVGTLFPVLGFVNVYPFRFSFVADHFQYLASIGLLVPAAWGLSWIAGRLPLGAAGRSCLVLAVPAALGVLSWRQCRIYRDPDTLYRSTIAANPSAWLAHYNLAVSLGMGPGHIAEAISEYETTLRLKPDHWEARNNLATALTKLPGRLGDAIAQYELALRYNPDFAEAHNNLGVALDGVPGREGEAREQLRAAIRIRPDYAVAHCNLGNLLVGDPETLAGAVREFEAAVRIEPGAAQYHYALANALSLQGARLEDAADEYRAALRLRPGQAEAHANLANALARLPGRGGEAIAEYSAALRIDPSDAQSHYGLGLLLAREPGRVREAIEEFETAVQLNPGLAEAHFGLGISLAISGRRNEAEAHLKRALEIRPGYEPARKALNDLEEGRR